MPARRLTVRFVDSLEGRTSKASHRVDEPELVVLWLFDDINNIAVLYLDSTVPAGVLPFSTTMLEFPVSA